MKKRMFQVLSVLFAFIFLLSAAAVPASAAAVKNTSTHLRTSYNSDNYIDYRITGTELAVAGKLDIRNLEKIGLLCADENKLTADTTADASQGQLFRITISLKKYKTTFGVDLYSKRTDEKLYTSVNMGQLKVTEKNGVYTFSESLVAENNASFRSHWFNPDDYRRDMETIPDNVRKLSDSIVGSETDDYQKLFLIHKWVAENLYYDLDQYYGTASTALEVQDVLAERRSVCQGYADLMQVLIQAQDIPCMLVCTDALGLSTTNNSFVTNDARAKSTVSNHAHNEAYVDGRWIIMDTTWDSKNEYRNGEYLTKEPRGWFYFDITPELFDLSHKIISIADERFVLGRDNTLPVSDDPAAVPSSWAQPEVAKALWKEIVPDDLQTGYGNPISRLDFCRLLVKMLCIRTGTGTPDALLGSLGMTMQENLFSDTEDESVRAANLLGIVNGTGDGKFSPDDGINREQAACMLTRAAQKFGILKNGTSVIFQDNDAAESWALDSIAYVSGMVSSEGSTVMGGTGASSFSPKAPYSVEQSILTVYRMFMCK